MERPNRKSIVRKLLCKTSGFTFVETIIAFSIVGIFLTLTWGTVTFLLSKTMEQIERTRGHFLATEGIELVRQIRLTALNRNREIGFMDSIRKLSGDYSLSSQGEGFTLESVLNGGVQMIEMDEEPYTTYCRTLTFSSAGDDQNQRIVISSVRWGDPEDCSKGDKQIAYSTLLADMTQ